ncbi:CaiB/BaiF CoA-transferase family protein [Desulforhopalus sp. IMCC35007]|uniref:CaiB/BaiF CoA transferase family protein n=1 Tax=Desulforhopalus sp. IMCC35007 TaxID=2569543 RepID=UPI0010AE7766|nr:CaiB/BaiF CoA-transferase family protein [Desulforhopalus sp. IMCC35007]TKB06462.1 CoA transferase [Desulforhopalus sp. IMCC35007]
MAVEKDLPLRGVTVLELGHMVMGPTCGLVLGDLGADVYKVEPTGSGDDTRWLKNFGSGFFTFLNRNKKSISIDLKSDQGRDVFYQLVQVADVVIENFGPGTVERLGVDYDSCKKMNPGLIYCSLKGFMPGPYEKRFALDEVVQMMGGLAYMTGPSGRPLRAGASVTDIFGGSFGVIGILAALYERKTSGKGTFVQAGLYESVAFLVGQHMAVAAVTGEAPQPMPERGRSWAVYDLFTTADNKEVFIGITSDRHWSRFCRVFDFSDWQDNQELATNQLRIEAREWLLPELTRRLSLLSQTELMDKAEQAGIPFGPVNQPVDLKDDVHMNESDSLCLVKTPAGQMAKLPKIPLRLDGSSFGIRHQPPGVGEGTLELLQKTGMTEAEIERLVLQGVLQVEQ